MASGAGLPGRPIVFPTLGRPGGIVDEVDTVLRGDFRRRVEALELGWRPFDRLGPCDRLRVSGGSAGPLPQAIHQRLGPLPPAIPVGFGLAPGAAVGAGAAAFGGLVDVIGPGGGEERIVVALARSLPGGLLGNIGGRGAEQGGEQLVEPPGAARGDPVGGAAPVEPGEMGEQQPAVVAPPPGDLLAMIEHRLLDPVERALGQHLLGMIARQHQRRIPPRGEPGRTAAADIDRLRRDAHRSGGIAHRPAGRQRLEEAGLAIRGEGVVAGFAIVRFARRRKGAKGFARRRGGGKPLPVRGSRRRSL